jgi:predicted kinase
MTAAQSLGPSRAQADLGAECRLIVLRGPSAAGKSTVACELARSRKVAILQEDYFRRVILQRRDEARSACRRMLHASALAGLESGFHVVLEGILNSVHYASIIEDLVARWPERSFLYYFDVSLGETLRRHESKPIAGNVPPSCLREWYAAATPLGLPGEMVIPETFTLGQTVDFIERTSGLASHSPDSLAAAACPSCGYASFWRHPGASMTTERPLHTADPSAPLAMR